MSVVEDKNHFVLYGLYIVVVICGNVLLYFGSQKLPNSLITMCIIKLIFQCSILVAVIELCASSRYSFHCSLPLTHSFPPATNTLISPCHKCTHFPLPQTHSFPPATNTLISPCHKHTHFPLPQMHSFPPATNTLISPCHKRTHFPLPQTHSFPPATNALISPCHKRTHFPLPQTHSFPP